MNVELTIKEFQLIKYIREELPFGKATLITHNGEPKRLEDIKKMKVFTAETEEPIDKK